MLRNTLARMLIEAAEALIDVAAYFLPDACPIACNEGHTYKAPCALARKGS